MQTDFQVKDFVEIEQIMKGLGQTLGGDIGTQDISRIFRLPGTDNLKIAGNPRPVTIEMIDLDRIYDLEDFQKFHGNQFPGSLTKGNQEKTVKGELDERLPVWVKNLIQTGEHGGYESRSERDHAVICALSRFEYGLDDIEVIFKNYPIGEKYREKGNFGRQYLQSSLDKSVTEPVATNQVFAAKPTWPAPLAKQAYHGVVGKLVMAIEPHTEADPVAIFSQVFCGLGNTIYRGSYFSVEGDTHYLNLFFSLVGETAKGRKGTSWGHSRNTLASIDPEWASERIMSGLSSGEGLIWQVRDPIIKKKTQRDKKTGEYITEDFIEDPGVDDKRLLIIESELATALRVLSREGNTLSPIIRQAWDGGSLQSLTKNSPAKATGAHISIIGHITRDELRRYLDRTEIANGFGNRFIHLCVRRSKVLPEGGRIQDVDFGPILRELSAAIQFARKAGELRRDEAARDLWAEVYPELSEGKPGMAGALISRAEAQVMRLASLYAVMDQSNLICPDHLLAALALWDYAEASVQYIFGNSIGDPIADQVLTALTSNPAGLTQTDIHNSFGRHKEAHKINGALHHLESLGLIRQEQQATGGRPTTIWRLSRKPD